MLGRHVAFPRDEDLEQQIHRYNVTTADGAVDKTGEFLASKLPSAPTGAGIVTTINRAFETEGSPNIILRGWGNASNSGSCIIHVVGWPKKPTNSKVPANVYGKGRTLIAATLACGTSSSTTGLHPVDGRAESGVSFFDFDTLTLSTADDSSTTTNGPGTNQKFYNWGNQDREGIIMLDTFGIGWVYVFITTITTITRVDIALQRI